VGASSSRGLRLDVEYATGAALALRGDAVRQVGLFDELFNPAYMEEVDLCARLRRAGYRIVVNPNAAVVHYEGTSTPDLHLRSYWFHRGRLLYLLKHATAAELSGQFWQAEKQFIQTESHPASLFVLKRAYRDALVDFAQWHQSRVRDGALPFTEHDQARIIHIFSELRNQSIERDRDVFDTYLNIQG
jgi:GT2 family glycosyltransferase